MLDIVTQYASQWQYSLNPDKSVVMVIGEAARTRGYRGGVFLVVAHFRKWTSRSTWVPEDCTPIHHPPHLREMHLWKKRLSCTEFSWVSLRLSPPTDLVQAVQHLSIPILLYRAELWTPTKNSAHYAGASP